MINLSQITNLARTFLPPNSPWLDKINQAQQLASTFSHSPQGVKDLMRQFGKSQEDINKAINMLNNPFIANIVNKISPNMVATLRDAGAQISKEDTISTSSTISGLQQRLNKL